MLSLVFGVSTLLTIAIALLIAFALLYLVAYAVNQMAPPAPVRWLIWAVVLLVLFAGIARYFGLGI